MVENKAHDGSAIEKPHEPDGSIKLMVVGEEWSTEKKEAGAELKVQWGRVSGGHNETLRKKNTAERQLGRSNDRDGKKMCFGQYSLRMRITKGKDFTEINKGAIVQRIRKAERRGGKERNQRSAEESVGEPLNRVLTALVVRAGLGQTKIQKENGGLITGLTSMQ